MIFQTLLGGSVVVGTTLPSNEVQTYPCLAYIAREYTHNPSIIDTLFVSDFYTEKKLNPLSAFFVINAQYKATCSKYPIFAFENENVAKRFAQHYSGAVRDFDFALFVAQKDLKYDLPILQARDARDAKKNQSPSFINDISNLSKIEVPTNGKCPVCGMFVAKYPKWAAHIVTKEGHNHYFDGVKDMMKFYFEPQKYHHDHNTENLIALFVSDYYTLEKIATKDAFFVVGSNIYGPMGHELIPFKNEVDAKSFSDSHNGKKIYRFDALTRDIVWDLDK